MQGLATALSDTKYFNEHNDVISTQNNTHHVLKYKLLYVPFQMTFAIIYHQECMPTPIQKTVTII